jgi:drug/metabolite transporter (DMT)-like permease
MSLSGSLKRLLSVNLDGLVKSLLRVHHYSNCDQIELRSVDMTTGYILAILTGLLFGLQGTYGKYMGKQFSPATLTWATFAFAVPFISILLAYWGIPHIDWPDFLWSTTVSFVVNVVAWNLFFRALSLSPLSLTMPFTSLTPVFLVPVAFVILGELPGPQGLTGIILIIAGAYGLHFESGHLLGPLLNLFREKGTRYMLIVAIIWALSATVEKVAILSSSPEFYGLAIHCLLAAAYSPYVCHRARLADVRIHIPELLLLGLISSGVVICQFTALKYLYVSYVIAFKRAGIVVSVFLGHILFGEARPARNLSLSVLMIIGAALLIIQ